MARHIESDIQASCIKYFRYAYPELWRLCFAVPNGGVRNKVTAAIMKREGQVSGVADILLLVPSANKQYSFLAIEFKAPKNGIQSGTQKEWQKAVEKFSGGKYIICRSIDDFIKEITEYLN